MKIKSVILAGGKGTRLGVLTIKRAKPAVPFGGKYRIIDFALSNCVNSNVFDVLVLTQYRPHSLNDHIGKGRPLGPGSLLYRRRTFAAAFSGQLRYRLVRRHG